MDKNRKEIKGRHKYANQMNRIRTSENRIPSGFVMKGQSCNDGEPSRPSPDHY